VSTTVGHKEIHNWWDGKVIIDEVREYTDQRGSLIETWRTDEDKYKDSTPKMCYSSFTNPYIMRGPHQHADQTDWFYTYKNKMVYHLYNPETKEMKFHFTDPTKVTRVKVAPPIIHSYRNLENSQIFTSNFPTSLFMGEDKKETIDEIRHEHKFANNKTYVILGANGRLGKAITKQFFDNMGFHSYDVIPINRKLNCLQDIHQMSAELDTAFRDEQKFKHNKDVCVINCAAFANVQEADKYKDLVEWTNVQMPFHLATECSKRDWRFIQFSSDYVYQRVNDGDFYAELGAYTQSKIRMEDLFLRAPDERIRTTHILRVCNLYSDDPTDCHNVVGKFNKIVNAMKSGSANEKIRVVDWTYVLPTNVKYVAKMLYQGLVEGEYRYHNFYPKYSFEKYSLAGSRLNIANVVPDRRYGLVNFVKKFFGVTDDKIDIKENVLSDWTQSFEECSTSHNWHQAAKIELKVDENDIIELIKKMNQ
jgi:dTDP-4-dehydrorhamnose 3,5-epimerase